MTDKDDRPRRPRPRLAVIGCGPIGALHAGAIAGVPGVALAAVCDLDPRCAEAVARDRGVPAYHAVDDLLAAERPDGVTVATPDHLHRDVVLRAVEAGCHVFCEKPLAETTDDARAMVDAAQARGVWLAVDFNRRFGAGYLHAHGVVSRGEVGQVTRGLIHVTDRTPPAHVARHPLVIFTTLLSHHIDLMRVFCGEVTEVFATVPEPGGAGTGLVRDVVVSLRFGAGAGAVGVIVAGYRDGQTRTVERAAFEGEGGQVVVEDVTRRVVLTGLDPDRVQTWTGNPFAGGDAFYETVTAHVRTFAECVATGQEPPVTGRDGLRAMAVAAAAVASLERGRPVRLTSPESFA